MPRLLQCAPLVTAWPKRETSASARKVAPFSVGYDPLFYDLERELELTRAGEALAEFDMVPARFRRLDTRPFADGPVKSSKVLLTFTKGDLGRLVFACDTYRTWMGNLRGISLTLTNLRAIDRYGATAGEQYRGFKALPSGSTSAEPPMTPTEAARILIDADPAWLGATPQAIEAMTANVASSRDLAKYAATQALKVTHPDAGGSAEAFRQVQRAREVLAAHHGTAA